MSETFKGPLTVEHVRAGMRALEDAAAKKEADLAAWPKDDRGNPKILMGVNAAVWSLFLGLHTPDEILLHEELPTNGR